MPSIRKVQRSALSRRASRDRRSRSVSGTQGVLATACAARSSPDRTPREERLPREVFHCSPLDVEVAHAERVRLDERAPRLDLLAHQRREDFVRRDRVLDLHLAAGGAPSDPSSFPTAARDSFRPGPCSAAVATLPRASAEQPVERFLERLDGLLLFAALDRRRRVDRALQHVGRGADLRGVAAGEEVAVDGRDVRRAVMRAHDDEAARLGRRRRSAPRRVIVGIADRRLQRRGARRCRGLGRQIDRARRSARAYSAAGSMIRARRSITASASRYSRATFANALGGERRPARRRAMSSAPFSATRSRCCFSSWSSLR